MCPCFPKNLNPSLDKWFMPSLDASRSHAASPVIAKLVQLLSASFADLNKWSDGKSESTCLHASKIWIVYD